MEYTKKARIKPFSKWSSATSFSAKVNGEITTITNATGGLTFNVTYFPTSQPVVEQEIKPVYIFTGEEKL